MTTEIVNAGQPDYEHLHFGWFLVDWCNYKCSYCSAAEVMAESYSKEKSNGLYKLTLERLRKVTTPFDIDIYGGEPTLHPEFNTILSALADMEQCRMIEVKTNLSRSLSFYQQMYDHPKLYVSASYHPEHHNWAFIEKCIALKDNNFSCHISMSDRPEHWAQTIELISLFDKHGVNYDFNMLFSVKDCNIDYTPEFYAAYGIMVPNIQLQPKYRFKFADNTIKWYNNVEIEELKLNSFKGFNCQALMYEINTLGEIKNMCTGRKLPLIIKREHTHITENCPLESCSCDVMFNFYKERK